MAPVARKMVGNKSNFRVYYDPSKAHTSHFRRTVPRKMPAMSAKKRSSSKSGSFVLYETASENASRLRFSGHQTFAVRNGWLEKGVGLVRKVPGGFLADDAVVRLGVGKNMVESIKYWCLQTGLIEDADQPGTMRLAQLGRFLFGDGDVPGVDPFLEDDASLWLLHHHIATRAPQSTWSVVLNHYNKPEFTKAELETFIARHLADRNASVSEKTIERDVECFLHFYAGTRSKVFEESADAPFLALGLVQPTASSGLWRINIGRKHNLPDAVVGFATLHFMATTGDIAPSLSRLLFDPLSPGQVFKLDQASFVDALLRIEHDTKGRLRHNETAGMETVLYEGSRETAPRDAMKFLAGHYGAEA